MRRVSPELATWDTHAELMAALIEVTDYGNRLFYMANSKKGAAAPKPIEIRRPKSPDAIEAPKPERRMATTDEMKAFFGGAVTYTPTEGG